MGRCWATALIAAASVVTVADARAAEDEEAILGLTVNTLPAGDVRVIFRGNDILIERSALAGAGLEGFTADEIEVRGTRMISLASVKPQLRFRYDEKEVALAIHAPPELFPKQKIDLSVPPKISYERRTSVFVNYSPSVTLSTSGKTVGSAFFDSGLSERNRLWYSGLFTSTENGVARGLTNVTFIDRAKMLRLTLGDTRVSAGAIGGSEIMGGVTLAKDFSINPYFIRFPSMRFTSITEVPATLDIYVNGIRVRSQPLNPGAFTLDGLRGVIGAGRVTYVVRDALGRMSSVSSLYYVGPTVLAKGVDDYAVSVGLPRERIGLESFAYEGPALISYYQRGISDRVTLGARAEGRWERASFGPYVATSTPFGIFGLEAGVSAPWQPSVGLAGVASYSYLSRRFSVNASIRALTSSYATVTLAPEMDRSLWLGSASMSVPITRKSSLSTLASVSVDRDLPTMARVGMMSQTQITPELSVLAQAALVSMAFPQGFFDTFLGVAWAPRTNVYAGAGVGTTSGEPGLNLQAQKTATVGEDWGLASAMNVARQTDVSVVHRLQTPKSTITTYFDRTDGGASLSINPAGSLVWVEGGRLSLARPVFDSFALVRVPKLQGVRVLLNSQEVGRTNESGELIVPSLISYYGSHVKIVAEDVPLTHSIERDSVLAAPPLRGAAYVEFPVSRVQYTRGRARLVKGKEKVVPVFGDLAIDPGPKEQVSPIGTDGIFELEGVKEGEHDAEIRHGAEVCRFKIDVKASDGPYFDLGVVECVVPE